MHFHCPHCNYQRTISANQSATLVGKKVRCPKCKEKSRFQDSNFQDEPVFEAPQFESPQNYSDQWYYHATSAIGDGQPVGPMTVDQLKAIVLAGKLKKTDYVLSPTKTNNGWVPVGEISLLAKMIDAAAAPRPMPTQQVPFEAVVQTPVARMATPAYKTCPWCSETVRFAARKCRHCGEMLTSQSAKIANLDPKIVTIAETQKAVMFVILGQLASFFVVMFVPEAATLILLVVGVVSLVFILKFFIATLGGGLGTVMCILTLIPCVGMIVLLIGNAIATSKLKAAGIEVGLMGADTSQFS